MVMQLLNGFREIDQAAEKSAPWGDNSAGEIQ